MKKLLNVLFLLMVYSIFIPCVYAIDIGSSAAWFNDNSNLNICANPSGTDTIVIDYEYDSRVSNEKKVSKIQVDFTLPNGFSVSPSQDHMMGSNDNLISNGNNSYTLVIGNYEEIYYTANFKIDLHVTSAIAETKYDMSAVAKVYNMNNDIIETKSINYKYVVLNEEDNHNCDDNWEITSMQVDGRDYANNGVIETTNSAIDVKFNLASSKSKIFQEFDGYSKELTNNSSRNELKYGENNLLFAIRTECFFLNEKRDQLYESCDESAFGFSYSHNGGGVPVILLINRIDSRSNVNSLKSLSISNVSIAFKSELKNYMATVPYNVSSVKISSSLTDSKSSYVDGFGNRTVNLNEGVNTIQVKVRAENGSETAYTIKITRDKNNDSTLKQIKVDDNEILVKENTLRYTYNVDNDVVKPVIEAIPNDSNAKVEIDSFSELKEGDNDINIIVTASNGMKSNYVLNIIRDKLISTNSSLKNIIIKNHDINFDSSIHNYKVKLSEEEEKIDITVETANNKATYLVTGNKELKNGSIVKVKVTAEDGISTTTYNIEIEKEVAHKDINFIPIIIILFIVIIIVILIVILRKKKNNKLNAKQDNLASNSSIEQLTSNVSNENIDVKKDEEVI